MMPCFDDLMRTWGRFLEIEPWRSVANDEIFSIEDEVSGETHYAAILGSAGTEFGLSLARGAAGLRALGGLIEEDLDCDEAALAGDMLSITVHVDSFPPSYRKFLRAAAGPSVSLRGLPLIFAIEAGRMPRVPREDEIALLARAVGAVVELLDRGELRTQPFRPGAPMPCIVLRETGGIEQKQVRPVFQKIEYAAAQVPEELMAAVRALPRVERTILISCSIAPTPVQEGQVRLFLALDAASGLILDANAVLPGEIDALAERLCEVFENTGGLPNEIQTDSRIFYESIKSILAALGIRVLCVDEIPKLVELRETFAEYLDDRRKRRGRHGRED